MFSLSSYYSHTAFMEIVFDTISIIIADLDTGEIVFNTRSVEDLFGCKIKGELEGKNIDELVPDNVKEIHSKYREAYSKYPVAGAISDRESTIYGKKLDGTIFPLHIGLSAAIIDKRRYVIAILLPRTRDINHDG